MSRIYFHSEAGEAELSGAERAYMGSVCSDLFVSAMGLVRGFFRPSDIERYRALFPTDHYLQRGTYDERHVETAMRVGEEFFTPTLNTALVMGSDELKLLARLHGQCEIHAYVEGENRVWLASLIDAGRGSGLFRTGMGWESVATFLRSADDAPVVTSYSVCEQFPNAGVAGRSTATDEEDEAWYNLPEPEKWRLCMEKLRAGNDLELAPDNWNTMYFMDGTTAFDLLETMRAAPLSDTGDKT